MILEVFLVKIGARVNGSTNGCLISLLPKALGPNCPKLVFRPQTPNFRALESEN